MKDYEDSLRYILENGEFVQDRTGVGTYSVTGMLNRYDLSETFPAVTTKRLAWKSVVGELLWFLEGSTDERRLAEITFEKPREELFEKKTIWTANADAQGVALGYENNKFVKELGPVYGKQWRDFAGVDQIRKLVSDIENNPASRRHIISAWNAKDIDKMALPPCHVMSQFIVRNGEISCLMYQRSADYFLGVPFNIASYSLLTNMIAKKCDLKPKEFIHLVGDAHIYSTHVDAVKEQLSRSPRECPILQMPDIESFDVDYIRTLRVSDFKLEGYNPHSPITAEMAV